MIKITLLYLTTHTAQRFPSHIKVRSQVPDKNIIFTESWDGTPLKKYKRSGAPCPRQILRPTAHLRRSSQLIKSKRPISLKHVNQSTDLILAMVMVEMHITGLSQADVPTWQTVQAHFPFNHKYVYEKSKKYLNFPICFGGLGMYSPHAFCSIQ